MLASGSAPEWSSASRSTKTTGSTQLKAGQNSDGWVVWDMPKAQVKGAKVQLKVASLFSESEYGYWTLG